MAWSPDGRTLASGGNDNVLNLWSAVAGGCHSEATPQFALSDHCAAVKAVAWCPWQSSTLATGGGTADRWKQILNSDQSFFKYCMLTNHIFLQVYQNLECQQWNTDEQHRHQISGDLPKQDLPQEKIAETRKMSRFNVPGLFLGVGSGVQGVGVQPRISFQ